MTYDNLCDAWRVLLYDNVPAQHRPPAYMWRTFLRKAEAEFGREAIRSAEAELAKLRQPNDLGDIDSPLWQVVAGGDDTDLKLSDQTEQIVQWMFDNAMGG